MPIEEDFLSQQGLEEARQKLFEAAADRCARQRRTEELRQKLFEAAADRCARQRHGCEGALDTDKGNDESEPLRVRVHERLVEAREAAKHAEKLAELERLLSLNAEFARILDLLDETTD